MSLKYSLLTLFLLFHFHLSGQPYTLVVYNVENLFDADGIALYNDYKPLDASGKAQYTPMHVATKIINTAKIMKQYNNGAGPDILFLVEIESDQTQPAGGNKYNLTDFLHKYRNTTINEMLGNGFNEEIADIPAELLLLKGFFDAGLTGYDISVAYDPLVDMKPTHAVKNVIFSRLPIDHSKTRSHAIEDARPILETWVIDSGHHLVLFNNHWKSGASNADIEKTRLQNAQVLKNRLDELRSENPRIDMIIAGDFNSDYNQSHRYSYMEKTGINDVLRSTGNESAVAAGHPEKLYNLWYEWPKSDRGSDHFRGYWGTLMQILISPGLYDYSGMVYIDNSFEVGRFSGINTYSNSKAPVRWSNFKSGYGFSDHFPISMRFTVIHDRDTSRTIILEDPSNTDDLNWKPIPVTYNVLNETDYISFEYLANKELRTDEFFDKLIEIKAKLSDDYLVNVNGKDYELYSPSFNIREVLASKRGEEIKFVGRLGIFRGRWQFVIESRDYLFL